MVSVLAQLCILRAGSVLRKARRGLVGVGTPLAQFPFVCFGWLAETLASVPVLQIRRFDGCISGPSFRQTEFLRVNWLAGRHVGFSSCRELLQTNWLTP